MTDTESITPAQDDGLQDNLDPYILMDRMIKSHQSPERRLKDIFDSYEVAFTTGDERRVTDKIIELIDDLMAAAEERGRRSVVSIIDRKKKFYEGGRGDRWEGYTSCLDTLKEELLANHKEDHE